MEDIDSDDIPSSTLGATPSEADYDVPDLPDDLKRGDTPAAGTPADTPQGTPVPGSKKASSKSLANLTKSGAVKQKPGPKPGTGKPKSGSSAPSRTNANPQLRQTSFAMVTPINQKNYYTEYLKRDDQVYVYRQVQEETRKSKKDPAVSLVAKGGSATGSAAATPDPDSEAPKDENRTLVIHPGSRNLRVGFGVDPYPKTVKMVIARRSKRAQREANGDADVEMEDAEGDVVADAIAGAIKTVKKDLKERMKFYKCRIQPGSTELTTNYNTRSSPEEIPEHNDPSKVEWTESLTEKSSYYVGEPALRIKDKNYNVRWPLLHGCFNETSDYSSPQEVLGDIAVIIVEALESLLGVNFSDYKNYNVILLVPDLYDKAYVGALTDLLLHKMDFPRVALLQEAMGATFGAGISTSCVVDVGAQKTAVCCVEDGMIVPDSRVNLKYGGDDVTNAFLRLLQNISFPYTVDLNSESDALLVEDLKHKYATTDESSIGVSTGQFFCPSPNSLTLKYTFKFYDEGMLAPLGLFYPELFQPLSRHYEMFLQSRHRLFSRHMDVYESNKEDNPVSGAQTALLVKQGLIEAVEEVEDKDKDKAADSAKDGSKDSKDAKDAVKEVVDEPEIPFLFNVGLDHAIIQSIKSAALTDASRSAKMYENIIIVGGGALLAGFETLLVDRLGIWRSMARAEGEDDGVSDEAIAVMPPPRDMDPQILTWKGGAVFSRLKVVEEMYITQKEWDLLGPRSIHYRTMFAY